MCDRGQLTYTQHSEDILGHCSINLFKGDHLLEQDVTLTTHTVMTEELDEH